MWNQPFVSASITPADSRYFRKASFFVVSVACGMVTTTRVVEKTYTRAFDDRCQHMYRAVSIDESVQVTRAVTHFTYSSRSSAGHIKYRDDPSNAPSPEPVLSSFSLSSCKCPFVFDLSSARNPNTRNPNSSEWRFEIAQERTRLLEYHGERERERERERRTCCDI